MKVKWMNNANTRNSLHSAGVLEIENISPTHRTLYLDLFYRNILLLSPNANKKQSWKILRIYHELEWKFMTVNKMLIKFIISLWYAPDREMNL